MSYAEGIFHLSNVSSAAPSSLTAVADISSVAIMEGMQIRRLMFYVTTAPTVTAPVITFYKRTAVGVTAGQVAIGTITVPVGTPAGTMLYKGLDSVHLDPSQCLAAAVTVAASAGAGLVGLGAYQDAEDPQNISTCLLSV